MNEPVNVLEFEALARARMPHDTWEYICGGADDEITLRENRAAFERTFLYPRYLTDTLPRDLSTIVLGTKIPFPLLLAPTGYQMLSHPEGECETARGASKLGIPMLLSTVSTRTLEDVARAATCPLWYQLYMMEDMEVNEWLVRRAERSGYRAIVFTVDAMVTGNRERDRRNQLSFAQVHVGNLLAHTADAPASVLRATHYGDLAWKENLTWRDVEWLRAKTQLPILIKGILAYEDAQRALEYGCAGVIVSNHGGRQLDGAIASLDALPRIADTVGAAMEIYLDGGVRRGVDILKAVALGARAVCIGRPYLWGLIADGARGVTRVIEMLRDELEIAMALTGKRSVSELEARIIWRRG